MPLGSTWSTRHNASNSHKETQVNQNVSLFATTQKRENRGFCVGPKIFFRCWRRRRRTWRWWCWADASKNCKPTLQRVSWIQIAWWLSVICLISGSGLAFFLCLFYAPSLKCHFSPTKSEKIGLGLFDLMIAPQPWESTCALRQMNHDFHDRVIKRVESKE